MAIIFCTKRDNYKSNMNCYLSTPKANTRFDPALIQSISFSINLFSDFWLSILTVPTHLPVILPCESFPTVLSNKILYIFIYPTSSTCPVHHNLLLLNLITIYLMMLSV